ncbi:hypothetical protein L210DRAFT_3502517 [Boletus edulis BED1]|uniref:Uncharacterized protein n=1 Tax=Boletus edulis BED1 TaxID=1328754 RepID=A0AAD4GGK4_BOLED|nr:hypothetical protein L210DRAFT_3502517 [Boletus edulis BED1]
MQHKDDIIAVIEEAYYISADQWSGIIGVIIAETQNGNFLVQGLSTIVTETQNIKTSIINLQGDSGTHRCICIYDKKRHNDGTNSCPYLILGTYHGYKVQNMMEDDILDVAEVIDRMQNHVSKETEE